MSAAGGANDPSAQPSLGSQMPSCAENIPVSTRLLLFITLVGSIVGIFTNVFANVPLLIIEKFQVWRLLFSCFFGDSLLNSVFSLLLLAQSGGPLEMRKGSFYLLHATAMVALLTNILFFLVIFIIGWNPWDPDDDYRTKYTAGMWPVVFGLMAVETSFAPEPARRCMCFPFDIPTRYFPILLAAIFSIFGFMIDLWIGLLAGYLFVNIEKWQLGRERTLRLEVSPSFGWLTRKQGFVSLDSASGFQGGGGGMMGMPVGGGGGGPRAAPGRTFGSGASGARLGGATNAVTINSLPSDDGSSSGAAPSAATNATAPRSFVGEGHRLGSSGAAPARPGNVLADKIARQMKQEKAATTTASCCATPAATGSASAACCSPPSAPATTTTTTAAPARSSASPPSSSSTSVNARPAPTAQSPPMSVWPQPAHYDEEVSEDTPFLSLNPESSTSASASTQQQNAAAFQTNLSALMDLGYTREDALNALTHSGGDFQGAVDYLLGRSD